MSVYNSNSKTRARFLRKNQTDTERILWQKLRAKQLGYKFYRQYPIGHYILDFYCSSKFASNRSRWKPAPSAEKKG